MLIPHLFPTIPYAGSYVFSANSLPSLSPYKTWLVYCYLRVLSVTFLRLGSPLSVNLIYNHHDICNERNHKTEVRVQTPLFPKLDVDIIQTFRLIFVSAQVDT